MKMRWVSLSSLVLATSSQFSLVRAADKHRKTFHLGRLCLLTLLLPLLAPGSASALSGTWTSQSGGTWSDPLNWAGGLIASGSGDTVRGAAVHADGKTLQAGPSVLEGDAATARLKQQGHYESLIQAVQAERYAVETVADSPVTGSDGGCYAGNAAHALRCWFRPDGLELQSAGTQPSIGVNLRASMPKHHRGEDFSWKNVSSGFRSFQLDPGSGAVINTPLLAHT